jgi:hypothetical protein
MRLYRVKPLRPRARCSGKSGRRPGQLARIGRKLWDRGYRRSDGGQYQQAPVLRALKARQWTHVITPLQRLDGLSDG